MEYIITFWGKNEKEWALVGNAGNGASIWNDGYWV